MVQDLTLRLVAAATGRRGDPGRLRRLAGAG